MNDIPKRLRALRFLKIIYLIAMIASIGYLITLSVLLGIDPAHEWSAGGAIFVEVLMGIFNVARIVVVVLTAVTLILTCKVNKECGIALGLGIAAAVFSIVSGALLLAPIDRTASSVLSFVANLATAAALFALLDGIFERKARGTPLFHFVILGLVLYIIWAIFDLFTVVLPLQATASYALFYTSEVIATLADVIVFLALRGTLKEIDAYQKAESEAN
jgi:hypothetical protein